jgi:hypothetical protein
MQEASSEREQGHAGSDAAQLRRARNGSLPAPRTSGTSGDVQPVSLYGFLDRVVSDEHKTRRLGYLMRQAGFVAVVVLVSLAAVSYIGMYKAPLGMKAGVGGGSALFIMLGGITVRIRRTGRQRRARAAISRPLPQPPPEEGGGSQISEGDRSDSQHASDGNPHDDLGAARRS